MRVVSVLHEAVQKHGHVVEFEHVFGHHIDEVVATVLEEVQFGLLGVGVKELISDQGQSLNHQCKQVVHLAATLRVTTAFRRSDSIDFSKSLAKELNQVRQIHHGLHQNAYNLSSMILQAQENINDQLIGDVVKSVLEIADTSLSVLLEDLILRISLVQLGTELRVNEISENRQEGDLVTVLVHATLRRVSTTHLHIGLLSHGADGLVVGLDGYTFDVTNGHSFNSLLALLHLAVLQGSTLDSLSAVGREETSVLGLQETLVNALSLTELNVLFGESLGVALLGHFIGDSLQFVLFHFAGDCSARVFWFRLFLFFLLLLLDVRRLVVDHVAGQKSVEFLEETVGGIGSAMDNCIVVLDSDVKAFPLAEFAEVNPIVRFFVQLKSVIKLVHLNLGGVESLQNLSENPSIGQVTFGIGDLVRQIE